MSPDKKIEASFLTRWLCKMSLCSTKSSVGGRKAALAGHKDREWASPESVDISAIPMISATVLAIWRGPFMTAKYIDF